MELSPSQITQINQSLSQFWYGTKDTDRYLISDTVSVTISHTEDDCLRITVSCADINAVTESSPPPTLDQIETLSTVKSQLESILTETFGPDITPINLYKEPSVRLPMAQYSAEIDFKSQSQKTI